MNNTNNRIKYKMNRYAMKKFIKILEKLKDFKEVCKQHIFHNAQKHRSY